MKQNVGLIIGCARSGTSILGELAAAHPGVRYIFEPHRIWELGGDGAEGSHRLTAEQATPEVRAQIRTWFDGQLGDAQMVVDKTPRNALRVPFVRAVFPEAKIVHIVRDGRDVACSLMPGIGGPVWRHLKPPDWRSLMAQFDGIERCARAWQSVMEVVLDDLEQVPHLQIRYEDLVAEPIQTAEALMEYFGLSADPAVIEFTSRIQDEFENSYHAKVQDRWYGESHRKRVGRWKELESASRRRVNEVLAPVLARLGYDTATV